MWVKVETEQTGIDQLVNLSTAIHIQYELQNKMASTELGGMIATEKVIGVRLYASLPGKTITLLEISIEEGEAPDMGLKAVKEAMNKIARAIQNDDAIVDLTENLDPNRIKRAMKIY